MDQHRPDAQVAVDAGVIHELLARQCPEHVGPEPILVDEGWDNFTFRLGTALAVRLPRRAVAAELLATERRWLADISRRLSLTVPRHLFHGEPCDLFPWPWSVVSWVHGTTAEDVALGVGDAERLARDLRALHRPAPPEAPTNPFRGGPLASRRDAVEARLDRLPLRPLHALWRDALAAPDANDRCWLHGDLHPRNVIVHGGHLTGLIDWGDLNGGDPATDIACAWTLFEEGPREAFLRAYAPSPGERARAVGWAVNFGTGLLESGEPRHVAMGRTTIRRIENCTLIG